MKHSPVEDSFTENFKLDRKKEWDVKSSLMATCEFSSEKSSGDEDNDYNSSTCTMCTSSFSFCYASQRSYKLIVHRINSKI